MKKLVVASHNPEKVSSMSTLSQEFDVDVHMPPDGVILSEDGETYLDNALQKARIVHDLTGDPVFADDFGMEIGGLQKSPGVHTRRWAGRPMSDEELLQFTINQIKHLPEEGRQCDFVGVGTIVLDSRDYIQRVETDSGVLLLEPRGDIVAGHPLASLLYIAEYKKTLAELRGTEFLSKDIRIRRYLLEKFINL